MRGQTSPGLKDLTRTVTDAHVYAGPSGREALSRAALAPTSAQAQHQKMVAPDKPRICFSKHPGTRGNRSNRGPSRALYWNRELGILIARFLLQPRYCERNLRKYCPHSQLDLSPACPSRTVAPRHFLWFIRKVSA